MKKITMIVAVAALFSLAAGFGAGFRTAKSMYQVPKYHVTATHPDGRVEDFGYVWGAKASDHK